MTSGGPAEPSSSEQISPPKVFISYCWSGPRHRDRVRQWAERLISEGIDVVLDIFDLREGHDKYAFMEKMVTDPKITNVLVMSDKAYAGKADTRKAGVGAESQIISREVYEKAEQSKFIPIACEFSDGEPCLPTFLKSRIWIDFSSQEAANENWEKLVRAIYRKPLFEKPPLGKAPAYITESPGSLPAPASGKFSTFKHALLNNHKGLKVYREELLSECLQYVDSLRTRTRPDVAGPGEKVLNECARLKIARNLIVDWVLLESATAPTDEFTDALLYCLERLRELKSRPSEVNSWNDWWFEAHSVFLYETFLYIIAALLKTESFNTLHVIFTSYYLRPETERNGLTAFQTFECFYGHGDVLQSVLAPPRQRLYSPAAELIKRQADRADIPLAAVIEGELIVFLMASIVPGASWRPQTLHYASTPEFPFFIRATQHRAFLKLATITGIENAETLREAVKSGFEQMGVGFWHDFSMVPNSFWNYMNMDRLDTLK